MSTGTDAGLLDRPKAQSVYKHGIIEHYVIRYAAMTASKLDPKRCVLFDGFAGRGRFETGEPGSAEHMMIAAQTIKASTQVDLLLVEKDHDSYLALNAVADEYRERGLRIDSYEDDCASRLGDMLSLAKGASLFVLLDPCGAVLPMDSIRGVLNQRGKWPRTEVLLNFNAGLIRRSGGQLKKGQIDLGGVAKADTVCGGEWWRDVALAAHEKAGEENWESAAEAVALEYARRLTAGTKYGAVVAPVRRQVHKQPIYYLIFLTQDPHGFWVFGAAASKAREKWIDFLGPDPEEGQGTLWDTVKDQLDRENAKAVGRITENLRALTADGQPKRVVQHYAEIFGDVYGEAKETAFSASLRALVKSKEVEYVRKGSSPHQHVIKKWGAQP